MPWVVSGVTRGAAQVVPLDDGKPVYGGTPCRCLGGRGDRRAEGARAGSDVLSLHADGRSRPANGLTDPYTGADDQPAAALARADHPERRAGSGGLARRHRGGGGRGGGVLRQRAAVGLLGQRDHGELWRAGGVLVSALHPALRASLRGGGWGLGLLHRLGAARADPDPRGRRQLSGGGGAEAAGRRRAGRSSGRSARSAMPPTGRNISAITRRRLGRRDLPPRPVCGPTTTSISSASTTTCRCPTGAMARRMLDAGWGSIYNLDYLEAQRRRRRGLRLVLPRARGAGGAAADADRRHRLWRGLGLPLQGPARLVGEPASSTGRAGCGRRPIPAGCRG